MNLRTINPPPGSKITLSNDGADPLLTIPQRSGGASRYFGGLFMLFWLGAWFIGFRSAASEMVSGHAQPFLIFWLGAWTLAGGFALWMLYRTFRPPLPETLKLGQNGITHDSGIPPFQPNFNTMNQKQAWQGYFPKRTIVEIDRQQLRSLRLRETESDNRLTVDVDSVRLDIGRAATEVEREWLYQVLADRYSIPAFQKE
jgi:hypothetical protein